MGNETNTAAGTEAQNTAQAGTNTETDTQAQNTANTAQNTAQTESSVTSESTKKDLPSDEELATFRKWQEAQKSDAEKHAAAIGKAEKARLAAEEKAALAELKVTALSKGIAKEALDDVIALAKTKITDKVTADMAIDEIIKKYPAFSASAQSTSTTTGIATANNSANTQADDAKARRVMGLPEKK